MFDNFSFHAMPELYQIFGISNQVCENYFCCHFFLSRMRQVQEASAHRAITVKKAQPTHT